MLRLIRRPAGHAANAVTANEMLSTAFGLGFYTLLVALPISGWMLASDERVPVDLLGIPALPQWLFSTAAQSGSAWHTAGTQDSPLMTALIRIHVSLALGLSATVVLHVVQMIVDAPRSRGLSRDND
jgi:cytochrome b561